MKFIQKILNYYMSEKDKKRLPVSDSLSKILIQGGFDKLNHRCFP